MLIEEVSDKSRIGIGGVQYEIDTGYSLRDVRKYFGAESFTTAWYAQDEEIPMAVGQAGQAYTMNNGIGVNNLTPLNMGVVGGYIKIMNDGVNEADFDFHKIFDTETTYLKRGKEVKVTFTGNNPDSAFNVYLMKWVGQGEANPKILASRNNGSPVWGTGWQAVDSLFIPELASGEDQTISKNFTIPNDAIQYAYAIIPASAQSPCSLELKVLQEDVVVPFRTHFFLEPPVEEDRYRYANELVRFVQDNEVFYSLRYTINDNWQACPIGIAKDTSDITLDTKVNTISGSSAKGGEGALVFPNEGTVQMTVTFRVLNETDTANEFSARLVTFDADGKATPIPDADVTVQIPAKSSGSMVTLKSGSFNVKAKDTVGIQFKSNKKDGVYLYCNSAHEPLLYNLVRYKELTK